MKTEPIFPNFSYATIFLGKQFEKTMNRQKSLGKRVLFSFFINQVKELKNHSI